MAVHDPALPAAQLLLGPEADGLLRAALAGTAEVRRWWRSRTRYVPGRQLVVRYGVEVVRADGRTTTETVCAEQADREPPAGVRVLQAPAGGRVWLWRYPADPYLPGLAPAARPAHVRELLDRLGAPPGEVAVQPRAYRPTRRAVLEVRRTGGPADGPRRWFLKVVHPPRARRIADTHRAVARTLRAPLPLAADLGAGTLVLAEVPGRDLRSLLVDPSAPLPDAAAVVDLQQALAGVATGLAAAPPRPFGVRRPGADRRGDGVGAARVRALLPDLADVVDAVAAAAEAAVDPGDATVTIHGDLHEGQILQGPDGGLGLVDLDGTGPGALLDDAATMVGRALLVGRWHPPTRARSDAFAAAYLDAVAALVPAERVRRRAAGVVLGMAAGSFAAGEPGWRAEAEGRLQLAARLAGVAPTAPCVPGAVGG